MVVMRLVAETSAGQRRPGRRAISLRLGDGNSTGLAKPVELLERGVCAR